MDPANGSGALFFSESHRLESITATTHDDREFRRLVDWCFDVANLSDAMAACSENGQHIVRITLPAFDARLGEFARRIEANRAWTVERWT